MPKTLRHLAAFAILFASCLARSEAGDSTLPRNLYAELNPPAVPGVAVLDVDPTSADIEWPESLSTESSFRVEMRRFSVGDDRQLKMEWIELPRATIKRRGEKYRVLLRDLTPRQPYWIRVLPRAASDSAEPLFAVRFETPAKQPIFTARRITLGLLTLALAALVGLRWLQRK